MSVGKEHWKQVSIKVPLLDGGEASALDCFPRVPHEVAIANEIVPDVVSKYLTPVGDRVMLAAHMFQVIIFSTL